MRIFENLNVDFIGKRKTAYIISSALILISLISLLVRGVELGIDFKGGTEIALQFENDINITEIRQNLSGTSLGNVEVKTFGNDNGILVRTELQSVPASVVPEFKTSIEAAIKNIDATANFTFVEETEKSLTYQFASHEVANQIVDQLFRNGYQVSAASAALENVQMVVAMGVADVLENELRKFDPDNHFEVLKADLVGPKIGEELKTDAVIAIVLSLLVILVYLGFRFKFAFALGAVAALFHDVFITLGVFSILYGIIPGLNLEISISVVAAFLTLVGYSINDTVVVFDRVRENLKIHKTAPLEDNINKGINKTLRRTIVTSVTTLIVVSILLVFGGEVLRSFAFTLFFGILIGTYSSIFVASPFVYEYSKRRNQRIEF